MPALYFNNLAYVQVQVGFALILRQLHLKEHHSPQQSKPAMAAFYLRKALEANERAVGRLPGGATQTICCFSLALQIVI